MIIIQYLVIPWFHSISEDPLVDTVSQASRNISFAIIPIYIQLSSFSSQSCLIHTYIQISILPLTTATTNRKSLNTHLLSPLGQRHPQQRIRPLPPIRARRKHLRKRQLIIRKIQVPVPPHTQRIHPINPLIPHKQNIARILGIKRSNRIRLRNTMINHIIGIRLQTIRNPRFTPVLYRCLRKKFTRRERTISQPSSRDREEFASSDTFPIECGTIR